MDFEKAFARARTFCMVSNKLELKLKCFKWFRASSSSSSNFLYGSSKLKLKCFIWFRASSSSSSNFLYGFEQARNSLRESGAGISHLDRLVPQWDLVLQPNHIPGGICHFLRYSISFDLKIVGKATGTDGDSVEVM